MSIGDPIRYIFRCRRQNFVCHHSNGCRDTWVVENEDDIDGGKVGKSQLARTTLNVAWSVLSPHHPRFHISHVMKTMMMTMVTTTTMMISMVGSWLARWESRSWRKELECCMIQRPQSPPYLVTLSYHTFISYFLVTLSSEVQWIAGIIILWSTKPVFHHWYKTWLNLATKVKTFRSWSVSQIHFFTNLLL